jgi:anthranilate phosphoribosyltransferase
MMDLPSAIRTVMQGESLARPDMETVMRTIMTGEATDAQIGGFLIGLHMKGETVDEIAAAASVMRELATRVEAPTAHLVDTCGTGGDAQGTFNVSTATAFVVAAAGGRVAKHGNRSVSSSSGSADVLEAAGANLDLGPDAVAACLRDVGVGFLFAPHHHSAMRHAVGPRREMGARTLFNLLGPLTNPAGAPNQLLGVFGPEWVRPVAETLKTLGSERVMVVHSADGLDEISIGASTNVAELRDGAIHEYTIRPEDFGLTSVDLASVRAADASESLALMRSAFGGEAGPAADILALNAGAAIHVAGLVADLRDGVDRARAVLADGSVQRRLDDFVAETQRLAQQEA